MSYVIYDKETTRVPAFAWDVGVKYFKTPGAAKTALTRAVKAGKVEDKNLYAVAEAKDFHENIEKWVTRANLMSKKEFKEPINTPYFCSPSSETYWSM